jgi:hypothetical protein
MRLKIKHGSLYYPTIITTPLILLARASSPAFFQYVAASDSSPNIMVDPWENRWTGVNEDVRVVRAMMERWYGIYA